MTDDALPSSRLPDVIGGRYRIVSRLGVGGMGVVYKAIDQQLNRPVAVKAVEDRRLLMPGSSGRLRTEALAAASLDHPYICKVYELVETPTEAFIVMEFVEGETLSSILKRGVPPLQQSLQICREIAEGLAEAHAHALVHRDVKPANVMVTPTGHVKLLDFGVAGADVSLPAADHTRTQAPHLTVHAGTPQYMAPEQAAGQPITARADLFSLGVMLYECVSGALPFSGSTTFDYVRHVMQSPPRRLDRVAPDTPAELVELVEKCLEKTPADRPESADAVVVELRRLQAALASPGAAVRTAGQARAGKRWRVVAAIAIAIAVIAVGWRFFWRSSSQPRVWQLRPFVTSAGLDSDSQISPDGQWVSFISTNGGSSQVMLQRVDGGEARPMTLGKGTPVSQMWSPDGRELACVLRLADEWVLQIYPAFFGGEPRQTVTLGTGSKLTRVDLLRWIGRTMYLAIHDPYLSLRTLEPDARANLTNLSASWALPEMKPGGDVRSSPLRSVDVRPDGGGVVVVLSTNGQEDLWTANLDGTALRQLTNDAFFDRDPVWNSAGDRVIFKSNRGGQTGLWEIDSRTNTLTPLPGQAEDQVDSTAADGSLISFTSESRDAKLWLWPTGAGGGQQLTQDALSDYAPALSADGRLVVFQRSLPTPNEGAAIVDSKVFVAPFDGQRLTEDARSIGDGYAAAVSADGGWVAYVHRVDKRLVAPLFVRNRATGATTQVSTAAALPISTSSPVDWASNTMTWSPAGSELYFVDQSDAGSIRRIRAGEAADAKVVARVAGPETFLRDLHVSTDGRRLAYVIASRESIDVHVIDLGTGADRRLASLTGPFTGTFGRGWMGDEFVVVQRDVLNEDLTGDLSVMVIGPSGQVRKVGTIATAFIATARLHPARRVLYLTRLDRGVQNIYEFSLGTGALKPLTQNVLSGVTFSGLCPVGLDRLLGVREERRQDIWLLQQSSTKAPGNTAGR